MNALMRLGGWIDDLLAAGRWLALPVALLLALQWPLRDVGGAYSRVANDFGQICFALYVACAVTAATRARAHIAVDLLAEQWPPAMRLAMLRLVLLLGVAPWFAFILLTGWSATVRSTLGLETFADTSNPGYFLIKVASMLFAGLGVVQALMDVLAPDRLVPLEEPHA